MTGWKYCVLFIYLSVYTGLMAQNAFIQVKNGHFQLGGKPYHFLGTNLWYGMNLGSEGSEGNRFRLLQELDQLAELGVKNLRIMAASEGPDNAPWRMLPSLQSAPGIYNEQLLEGLDFLLAEMKKRDMYAVVCLNNFWPWSGGMAQYVHWSSGKEIPYPPPAEGGDWLSYMTYTTNFFTDESAMQQAQEHLKMIISRKNSFTGQLYKEDPTIMAWQLANEPRGILKARAYRKWITETAALIKSLDANHLLTIGSEGWTPSKLAGTHPRKDHQIPGIDYMTLHIWIQNWGWYDPMKHASTYEQAEKKAKKYLKRHIRIAEKLNMPLVLEEFGIARDQNDHAPQAGVTARNQYYGAMFEEVYQQIQRKSPLAGCNFWAWGGMGRPRTPAAIWQAGDDFIGDPPHEHQGWYSVYDQDETTLQLIHSYTTKIQHP